LQFILKETNLAAKACSLKQKLQFAIEAMMP
jgi:hypothetical protein